MERIKKLLKIMKEKEVDGFLVSSEANVTYLSNFTGDSSYLVVSPKGCAFFTDGRYTEQAEAQCHKGIEIIKWLENKRNGIQSYSHAVKAFGIKRLAFEATQIPYSTYKSLNEGLNGIELVPLSGIIEEIRMIKDKQEIEALRTACEISDKALELTIPYIKPGVTEMEIVARLEYNLKSNGAEGLSFDTMVLSGAKTSLLHGRPDSKRLENGDYILFDFGALYKGYHADISRTFILGKADNKQKELYQIIQSAEMEGIKSLKPGISARIPDKRVREIIPQEYIDYYYPGLGHGVGLQVHEDPSLSHDSKFELEKDMILTVEPGIYIPSWGGLRIEDTVLITENSYEILNKFPRDLRIL
ncbi:M24 family metallopeptidase [Paramaledivibacter caminithermalis]|jgi:Xaa-Pro aminopeptidase|uniref:Xaa-Pro aminopeptidase n=1 Tax=Paramaledivibacter caminithermalis (strain DSM 15212 / CIP 107654 / DViRD3) TaxID=1121301 RepID=A0A1M6RYW9_PARC5|nr:Xaa-Pro peptidase family protein [Paramaledivibacter caminithermalis]SHK37665.1 Xaa-Pro aminopeptidase [Paramaledivibacter caminithermalis DSM 15212]